MPQASKPIRVRHYSGDRNVAESPGHALDDRLYGAAVYRGFSGKDPVGILFTLDHNLRDGILRGDYFRTRRLVDREVSDRSSGIWAGCTFQVAYGNRCSAYHGGGAQPGTLYLDHAYFTGNAADGDDRSCFCIW